MRNVEIVVSTTVALALGLALACDPIESLQETPFVMPSATAEAQVTVDINRVRDGVFVPYRPRCRVVRADTTIEFRNFLPNIPTNVTGLSTPDGTSIYSPNLVFPYNYVNDNEELECLQTGEDGSCTERPEYSYWRYTFATPGVYDWLDTNQGEPGRKVVDPYYGTETFIGIDPNSPLGTICVRRTPTGDDPSDGCENVCCSTDTDCVNGKRCFKSEAEAVGRCLTPSG